MKRTSQILHRPSVPVWSGQGSPTVWLSQASFVESLLLGLPGVGDLQATIQLYEAREGVSAALARTRPGRGRVEIPLRITPLSS